MMNAYKMKQLDQQNYSINPQTAYAPNPGYPMNYYHMQIFKNPENMNPPNQNNIYQNQTSYGAPMPYGGQMPYGNQMTFQPNYYYPMPQMGPNSMPPMNFPQMNPMDMAKMNPIDMSKMNRPLATPQDNALNN